MRLEAGNRKWAVRVGNETGSEDRKRGLEAGNWKRRPETRLGSRKREAKTGNEAWKPETGSEDRKREVKSGKSR